MKISRRLTRMTRIRIKNNRGMAGILFVLIRVIRVNPRPNFLFCRYGLAGAAEGVAIIVTRFFQSAGLVE
jgi:hypothetical protein